MRMAAYCRVSTDKEEQLSSLENQREFFEQYAKKTGDVLVKIYADEGISGKSIKNRDAFTRLLADSEKDAFDYVAVKDISRFARNTSDFLYGIRTLRSNGVDVRFLSGSQTVIGESEFVLTVFAALAQEESANLSKRVIFGKRQNAKKGRVPNCVYGYDKVDTFTLAINPRESAVVRMMFKWYVEGDGVRRIAIKLNEAGIPTKRGADWSPRTVRRILQNPIYAGHMVNNKSVTKDFLEGTRREIPKEEWFVHDRPELRIVSDEDFELVGREIAKRQALYANESSCHRFSGKYVFSNLIKCGECGKSFTAKAYRWKNTYIRYRCCSHNSGACCANSVTVDERTLLEEIKKYLPSVIEDKNAFAKRFVEQRMTRSKNTDETELVRAKEKLAARRKKLREMYIAELITMNELKKEYTNIDSALKSLDKELSARDTAYTDDETPDIETLLEQFDFSNDDMRAIVDKIVVYPDGTADIFMK